MQRFRTSRWLWNTMEFTMAKTCCVYDACAPRRDCCGGKTNGCISGDNNTLKKVTSFPTSPETPNAYDPFQVSSLYFKVTSTSSFSDSVKNFTWLPNLQAYFMSRTKGTSPAKRIRIISSRKCEHRLIGWHPSQTVGWRFRIASDSVPLHYLNVKSLVCISCYSKEPPPKSWNNASTRTKHEQHRQAQLKQLA